jgi:GMP synthase (glutamine-hydrolysing)
MQEIAIIDFGSQYTHLIARKIREIGVVSHIYPNNIPANQLQSAVGLILSGGPRSILSDDKLGNDPMIFDMGIPILGLCYGHQLIAKHFGGKVSRGSKREYGLASLSPFALPLSPIFEGLPEKTSVWMSHGEHVDLLPNNFSIIGSTDTDPNTAVANVEKQIYGFQFHPEVYHTKHGKQMLENFVFKICNAEKNWSTDNMFEKIKKEIKIEAGDKKIFLLMSGGVDSTVCFALLEKVLGKDRVYGFHIDHGFMRQDESSWVKSALTDIGLDNLHVYNGEDEFFSALKDIVDPEEKRKIIGDLFLDITDRTMSKLNFNENEWLLGQGTIYPDTIESGGTKNADKIKTHHNRVDRITEMIKKGLIIEPIKDLYKDEVREIGLKLGLPEKLIQRHPFPGPGLAIRCLCSDGINNTSILQQFDNTTLYKLPIKSVGVQGDERTYAHPAVLLNKGQANNYIPLTKRESTSSQARLEGVVNWQHLRKLSPQITNEFKDINRVLIKIYGDESKLRSSIIDHRSLTKDRIGHLQKLDKIVTDIVLASPEADKIWQMPVVLIPFGYEKGESLVIRPVESNEAMTVKFAELSKKTIENLKSEIGNLKLVDFVFYDITNKPPGTIEWE